MTSHPSFLYNSGAINPAAPFPQSITIFRLLFISEESTTSLIYESLTFNASASPRTEEVGLPLLIKPKISFPETGLSLITNFIPL